MEIGMVNMAKVIGAEYIVSGDVQKVGYRDFVAKIGQKLKIDGFVENLEDGTVRIWCKGDEKTRDNFREMINVRRPKSAPLINVETINERQIEAADIKQTGFSEKYNESTRELAQGLSTGMNYLSLVAIDLNSFRVETNNNLNSFRTETNNNFNILNEKYHVISQTMGQLVEQWEKERALSEKRFEHSEKNIQQTEKNIERSEKNIENLLEILTQQKR